MTIIKQDDLIDSIADALQFISYYHPLDFIQAMDQAYQREENPAARDAIAAPFPGTVYPHRHRLGQTPPGAGRGGAGKA